jgi:cell division protein FtsN
MANLERGAYQPRIDNIRPFHGGEEEENAEEGSRLPLLIVIALVVLTAFAGVVWLAYTQGVERGRADAPRIIITQSAPTKAKLAAASTPYTGLNIYQTSPGQDTADTDTPPPPPTPVESANPPSANPTSANPTNSPPALRPSANGAAEASAATSSNSATAMPVPAAPPRVATHPPRALVKPDVVAATAQSSTPVAPSLARVAPQPPVVAPPPSEASADTAAAPSEPVATELHGLLLQIGSYKSDAEARASWRSFKARHAMAANYAFDVKKVDLGAKGTWYRLRIGTFADRDSADTLCEKLKADGASCLLAR